MSTVQHLLMSTSAVDKIVTPGPSNSDTLGRPLRDLRLSVIDQCNFRCTYCMPKETFGNDYKFLPATRLLSFEQLVKVAKAFASLGVRKIRLTGGEPLLRRNIETLIEQLASLTTVENKPMEVTLTTNGSLLAAKAGTLRNAGLNRVTVSLDSLDDRIFGQMNGVGFPVDNVLKGIEAARAAGLGPVKINVVVERDRNDNQVVPIARRFRNTDTIVRFIEYMDVGGATRWRNGRVVKSDETRALLHSVFPMEAVPRRHPSDTAARYRYLDGRGEVGFISSVSQPFCGECSRARVSADGSMYTCLFATSGYDLGPLLSEGTSSEDLTHAILQRWNLRSDRYSQHREESVLPRTGKRYPTVRMSLVGG